MRHIYLSEAYSLQLYDQFVSIDNSMLKQIFFYSLKRCRQLHYTTPLMRKNNRLCHLPSLPYSPALPPDSLIQKKFCHYNILTDAFSSPPLLFEKLPQSEGGKRLAPNCYSRYTHSLSLCTSAPWLNPESSRIQSAANPSAIDSNCLCLWRPDLPPSDKE